ncbi:MAG: DNA/RNA nuclease SfsA [Methanophagales archaeon ANME-1-THS]|nr:MAG: DNA/RNA nuclease SfsA [Methanophagales archaeon ANME-1-THS]
MKEEITGIKVCRIDKPQHCRIIERLNTFVVKVEINGRYYRAYLNNTGKLSEFLIHGRKAFCFKLPNRGKTDFRLFAIEERELGALIDTHLQMAVFEKAVDRTLIPWLTGFQILKRNVTLGASRIDYLLNCHGEAVYLEVKSAVLREREYALYPDCPSARGRKHLKELTRHVNQGGEAIVLFIAALPEVKAFKPNKHADSKLYEDLITAYEAGVEFRAISFFYNPKDASVYLYNSDLEVNLT